MQQLPMGALSVLSNAVVGCANKATSIRDFVEHHRRGHRVVDHPLPGGDFVGIGGHRDVVEDVTLPIARVRTWDDLVVSIPNKEAANKVVVNCTVLEWICLRVPFLRAPPSAGGDDGTGGLGVKMELRGWIKNPYRVQRLPAGWVEEVKERLDEAGIRIPYPHPSLYVEQVLPPGLPGARAPRAG